MKGILVQYFTILVIAGSCAQADKYVDKFDTLVDDGILGYNGDQVLTATCESRPTESGRKVTSDGGTELPPCFDDVIADADEREKRNANPDLTSRWPNFIVPYVEENHFTSRELRIMERAREEFHKYTCLRFKERSGERHYVRVRKSGMGGECSSNVGRVTTSFLMPNVLTMDPICFEDDIATAVHELMHAVGVYHEQNRPDRNSYVKIDLSDVHSSLRYNWDINRNALLYDTKYDYLSAMHYSARAGSQRGGIVIQPLDRRYTDIIGDYRSFSFTDLVLLNRMYNCDEQRECSNSCPDESFQTRDCTCYCKSSDRKKAVEECSTSESCTIIGTPCNCGTNGCTGLEDTNCNSETQACDCVSPLVKLNGKCVDPNNAKCTEVNEDCKCNIQSGSPCSGLANTECQTSSGACICKPGYSYNSDKKQCEYMSNCKEIGKPCGCDTPPETCDGLPNTYCNKTTKACECNEDIFNGRCVPTEQIECTKVGEDCRCTKHSGSPCENLRKTECNPDTDACTCVDGYVYNPNPKSKKCIPLSAIKCRRLGLACRCSLKPSVCSKFPDSECDEQKNSCECKEGYYREKNQCLPSPTVCNQLDDPTCKCHQHKYPCENIPNSKCRTKGRSKGACSCSLGFVKNNEGTGCEWNGRILQTNGKTLAPFSNGEGASVEFIPMKDTRRGKKFARNKLKLNAGAVGDGRAILSMPAFTGPSHLCIKMRYQLSHARITFYYSSSIIGNGTWYPFHSVATTAPLTRYLNLNDKIEVFPSETLRIELDAEEHPGDYADRWFVNIDSVTVKKCAA